MNKLPLKTRKALTAYLVDYPVSCERAKIIEMIDYKLEDGQAIADKLIVANGGIQHAVRHALHFVGAGCAEKKDIKKTGSLW